MILRALKRTFFGLEKCHQALICRGFSPAFQADDEGSIPFTRSNVFNHLALSEFGQVDEIHPAQVDKCFCFDLSSSNRVSARRRCSV